MITAIMITATAVVIKTWLNDVVAFGLSNFSKYFLVAIGRNSFSMLAEQIAKCCSTKVL